MSDRKDHIADANNFVQFQFPNFMGKSMKVLENLSKGNHETLGDYFDAIADHLEVVAKTMQKSVEPYRDVTFKELGGKA